jgi:hypothetical protein
MSTGLSSLSKLSEVSTVYPLAGMEYVFSGILLGFFIVFLISQAAMEQRHIKKRMGTKDEAVPSPAALQLAE